MNSKMKEIDTNLKSMSLDELKSYGDILRLANTVISTVGVLSILTGLILYANIIVLISVAIVLFQAGRMSVVADQISTLVADYIEKKSAR